MPKAQHWFKPGPPVKGAHTEKDSRGKDEPRMLKKGFPLLWFTIAAFILFGKSIGFSYTYLDDHTLILNNMEILKSPASALAAFSEDAFHVSDGKGYYYRPLLTLSFIADAITGQGNFAMFHFSNIIYHILATFLLFLFFYEAGHGRIKSFLFSLLFLVHPLVTQAVAWVPGRNDTLLAVFILGSFLSWLKFLQNRRSFYLLLHLVLFASALFTKENAIVLPFMVVIYSTLFLHPPLKRYVMAGTGWLVIIIIWAAMRYHAVGLESRVAVSDQLLSVIRNLPALLPFLGKTLFPFNLSVYPILADMKASAIFGIIAIVVMMILAWFTRPRQWFSCLFGLTWFLAFLLPSFVTINNLIPNFSEHRAYLALPGIFLVVMSCNPVRKADFSRLIPFSAMAVAIVLFSILSFIHLGCFINRFTFWQTAIETSPKHAFNYNNLGAMYFLNGDLRKAEPLFRKALEINPYEPMANGNTGLICMRTQRPAEAEKYYLEEIRINPGYDHVYFNLGLLYYNHSRYDEGILQWEKTLTVNPHYLEAYKALLFAYEKLNRPQDYERITRMARENGITP